MKKNFIAEIRNTLGALLVVFLVLKLTGLLAWSWLWILAPMWIPAAIAAALTLTWWIWYAYFKLPDEKKRKQYGVAEHYWKEYKRKHGI